MSRATLYWLTAIAFLFISALFSRMTINALHATPPDNAVAFSLIAFIANLLMLVMLLLFLREKQLWKMVQANKKSFFSGGLTGLLIAVAWLSVTLYGWTNRTIAATAVAAIAVMAVTIFVIKQTRIHRANLRKSAAQPT